MGTVHALPLYFITGFLGSGKTTLLNHVLDDAAAKGTRVGVIINEWGQESVDSVVVQNREIDLEELNNGQVFCSCLSTDFIKVLALFAEKDLDAVIVETSGMANPMPLHKLLVDLDQMTDQHYDYRGMTALVDPDSFLDLVGAINAIDEQIKASSRIIVNKIDLATPEELEEVRTKIRALNPDAAVCETSFARMDGFFDHVEQPKAARPLLFGAMPAPGAKEPLPRPGNFLVKTDEKLEPAQVEAFFRQVLPDSLRVKGIFLGTDDVWYYADGVNDQVEIKPLGYPAKETRVVVIPHPELGKRATVRKAWLAHCGSNFTLS